MSRTTAEEVYRVCYHMTNYRRVYQRLTPLELAEELYSAICEELYGGVESRTQAITEFCDLLNVIHKIVAR